MSDQTSERPPVWVRGDVQKINGPTRSSTKTSDLDAALQRSDMALLVVTGLRNGGVRRKVVFTIAAAMRALDLAANRGVPASVALVQLQPVGHVDLDGEGGQHE